MFFPVVPSPARLADGNGNPQAALNAQLKCRLICDWFATGWRSDGRHPAVIASHRRYAYRSCCPNRQLGETCVKDCKRYLLLANRNPVILPVGNQKGNTMKPTVEIRQSTLAWLVLKTLDCLVPLCGCGIARRIEQISEGRLASNQGMVYRLCLRLKQQGAIASKWGTSENNRRARVYRLTRAGRKQQAELQGCQQTADIIARFLTINTETQSCSC